jgi:integrase
VGQISPDILQFLLEDEPMKGNIRTKEKCPVCQKPFSSIPKAGLICTEHLTTPNKFYLDVSWKGQQKIFSNKRGEILDSFSRALEVQLQVTREIEDKTFDPKKYRRQEIEKFFTSILLGAFLSRKLSEISPSNVASYKIIMNRAIDHFGIRDVREIRKLDLIHFKEWLEGRGIRKKTLKNHLDNFRSFLYWCKNDLEIIDVVPALPEVDLPAPQWRWFPKENQIELLGYVPEKDRPIISFLMLHGCRPGEARALRCGDVDLASGTIIISRTWSGRKIHEKRKGRKARPYALLIHDESLAYIQARVESSFPASWLFPSKNETHYTENRLRRIWEGVRKAGGLSKEVRLYDATRHSFASQLINQGEPILNVSRLMGHSSTKMTEKYAHSSVQGLKATLDKMSLKKVVDIGVRTKLEPKAQKVKKR